MKRLLFDHNVPGALERFFRAHHVSMADAMGWARLKNGELLEAAEAAGFDVLLSSDKTIRHEQNMVGRKIAMVCMSDNHWPSVGEYGTAIAQAIDEVKPGEIRAVYCGTLLRASSGRKARCRIRLIITRRPLRAGPLASALPISQEKGAVR